MVALAAFVTAGCVSVTPAGYTPDGRQMFRIECPAGSPEACAREAHEACGGKRYVMMGDEEIVAGVVANGYTNPSTGQTTAYATPVRRRSTTIACGLPAPPDHDAARAARLEAAEPLGAPREERCDWWRSHIREAESERLRAWVKARAKAACSAD